MPTSEGESEGEGVVIRDGERYYDMERAAAYLGKKRATMWALLKRYGATLDIRTYTFPLSGKRAFLRRSDLDKIKNAGPVPSGRKDAAPDEP